jgi:hypothetical protein
MPLIPGLPFPVVAFDESGHSGDHLLDPEQPIYALASVHLDRDATIEVIDRVRPPQLSELKYGRLKNSSAGRAAILEVLHAPIITTASARVYPAHKPFMLAAKLFDNLIEPWYWERGVETRNRVFNIQAANALYRRGAGACGEARWTELLAAFVEASRRPDDALDRLAAAVRACRLGCTQINMRELLDKIPEGRAELREAIEAAAFEEVGKREVLDPVLPTFVFAGERWTDELGRIVIDFDDTPLVRKFHERLTRMTTPAALAEYGPSPGFKIPMNIEEIRLVRSHETPQVQIADVIAGACITFLAEKVPGARRDSELAAAIGNTVLPDLIENEIWPEPLTPFDRFL